VDTLKPLPLSSSRPDLSLLDRLAAVQNIALVLPAVIGAAIFAAWLSPSLDLWMPAQWSVMKANTALCMFLAALSLALSRPKHTNQQLIGSRIAAATVTALAGAALYEHLTQHVTGVSTLLAGDASPVKPGLMSLQTATFLAALGICLLFSRARKSLASYAIDALALGLVVLVLVIFTGYCFGASQLFGQSAFTRVAPQTLVCIVALTFVAVGRRAEYGYFSVLIGVGIGSRAARTMLPFALILPILIVTLAAYTTVAGWLSSPYAAALTAATTCVLFFLLVLAMAWRINDLERDLRDISITDEMTQTYNTRGFQLLGGQALREARRAGTPITILFFDLDGLKQTNDIFGHDVGSRFIRDVAELLRTHFHDADIVARVGGDEFAVVAHCGIEDAKTLLEKLEQAADRMSHSGSRQHSIRYSVGEATLGRDGAHTFSELVKQADAVMYERKRSKRLAKAA
jgi:diguanylate cyclase (GGDEF)-like protein